MNTFDFMNNNAIGRRLIVEEPRHCVNSCLYLNAKTRLKGWHFVLLDIRGGPSLMKFIVAFIPLLNIYNVLLDRHSFVSMY